MIKRLLIANLLVLFGSFAYAQEVDFGLKGGLNISTLGKSELGFQSRMAFHFGGTAEFITTPFFSVQTELLYSLQGAAIDRTQQIYLNYHYLNIPVLAKTYFFEDASFEIGMQYGYLFKAVDRNEFYGNELDKIAKHDFSAVFGLEYKLDEKFTFGLRYTLGIINTTGQEIVYEKRYTNRVLLLSIGYIF